MESKERLFRLQTFQHVLSTLYMYPIRLYNNDCYEKVSQVLFRNSKDVDELKSIVKCDDADKLIPTIQKTIKSNFEQHTELFRILDKHSEEINEHVWTTKPSNSLMFIREVKSKRELWLFLMIYDLIKKEFINDSFEEPFVRECLIDMKSVFIKLNTKHSIVIGRLFDEKHNIDKIVQNIINNYHINETDIFELTKLANKRNFLYIQRVKEDALDIKKAFLLFMDIIEILPIEISKDDLEKISVYIYMLVKENNIGEDLSSLYKNGILNINCRSNFESYYKQYITYRSFFQNEFTSRLKSSLAKKYTTYYEEKDEYYPIKEILKRVCRTINADGGCYIKYHLSKETLKLAAHHGDKEYIEGIFQYIKKINKKDKKTIKKSRVLEIINNFYDSKNQNKISKMILFNRKEHELLQPIANKTIYSNIAMPVVFKHKLLGVLLIDSFRKDAFTQNDNQLVLSISNALSVQIYDEIVDTNLFKIIENVPNQTQLDDMQSIENISNNLPQYINNIFFSIGVDIWIYQEQCFNRISSTLKNGKDNKYEIHKKDPEPICNLLKINSEIIIKDIRNTKKISKYKPQEIDKRINTIKIYPIKQNSTLIGAISIYNRELNDYRSIDDRSLKSVTNYIKIFISIINTIKRQKEIVHSSSLHDINQNLLMIDNKCKQLTNLLHSNFKYIEEYSRYRFDIKINDIERFTKNTKSSFSFIGGKGQAFYNKNEIELQLEQQYEQQQKDFKKEIKLSNIIYSIINSLEYKHKRLTITAKIEEIYIKIHPNVLEDIFSNLIQNAIKYSYQDTVIKIKTTTLKYSIQIRVENIGIGINIDEIDDIFEYGYRGYNATVFEEEINKKKVSYPKEDIKNSGFGLYKCNKLMKLLGGSIKLEKSDKIDNSYKNIFLLTIPANLVNQKEIFKNMQDKLMKKFKG